MASETRSVAVDGVFDIETENWDTFVMGGLLRADGSYRQYDWRDESGFVDELLSFDGTLWAHNGGKFDTLWLVDHIFRRNLGQKVSVGMAGARIVRLKLGNMIVRDSYALVPLKLKDFAKIGGTEKCETQLPCKCGDSCGGYCTISRSMPTNLRRRLSEYLKQDCTALLTSLISIVQYSAENGLDLCGTIGASAWSTAERMTGLPPADWSDARGSTRLYGFARDAYFGGRTQVIRPVAERGHRIDMASAYPAALAALALPCGEREEAHGIDARRSYRAGKAGIYQARIAVHDDCFLPPLPVRCADRIGYPVGVVSGTWTALEIARAEACGARVEEISRAITWGTKEKILEPFCRHVWKLRDAAGTTTPLGKWLKLYANSLTGKLAQDPETESCEIDPDDTSICPCDWDCMGGQLHGVGDADCCQHAEAANCSKCRNWTPIDSRQRIWTHRAYRIAECAYVHWAAYLTSYTRVEWHTQALSDGQGGKTVCMGDTDSIFSTARLTRRAGDSLGMWKYEGLFEKFHALAPKTYRYWDPDKREWVAKSKGIPDAVKNWKRLAAGVTNDRGVETFKTAARKGEGLFVRKSLTRHVDPDGIYFGDRKLGANNLTYPPTMIELQDREGAK